jgi:hypothetical protein
MWHGYFGFGINDNDIGCQYNDNDIDNDFNINNDHNDTCTYSNLG